MMGEKIPVSECNSGDIIALDVLNKRGVTLVAKDTVINDYIKERLIDQGVITVHIYNCCNNIKTLNISYSKFKEDYNNTVLKIKDIFQDLTTGKPLNYEKVSIISNQIYKNINENHNIIRCLTEVKNTDKYTYTHCVNTAFYSMLIGKWLDLSESEINNIIQSGLLHDIGKAKIPTKILNKGDILTREEYEIIKNHTTLGYGIVEDIDDIDFDIKRAILLHHERIDGSGYPFSISQNDINLYAKIVAVADVFDAMTSDRVYKKKATPFEAFKMFQTVGVGIFDTKILSTFLKNLAAYLIGSKVLLSNGKLGEIVFVPLLKPAYPIVKTASGYLDTFQNDGIRISSMI